MPKYGHYKPRFYRQGDIWVPSVTTILSILDKKALVQWAANEAVDYIKDADPLYDYVEPAHPIEVDDNAWAKLLLGARTAYKRKSEDALDIGTQFHEIAEKYLRDKMTGEITFDDIAQLYTVGDDVVKMFDNFTKWCKKHTVKPIHVELELHGDGYAGRCDLIAEIDGEITIADIKTSSAYYDEMGLQLAAYREAHGVMQVNNFLNGKPADNFDIKRNLIIRVDKKSHRVNTKYFEKHKTRLWNPAKEKDESVEIDWTQDLKAFMLLKDLYHTLCIERK